MLAVARNGVEIASLDFPYKIYQTPVSTDTGCGYSIFGLSIRAQMGYKPSTYIVQRPSQRRLGMHFARTKAYIDKPSEVSDLFINSSPLRP